MSAATKYSLSTSYTPSSYSTYSSSRYTRSYTVSPRSSSTCSPKSYSSSNYSSNYKDEPSYKSSYSSDYSTSKRPLGLPTGYSGSSCLLKERYSSGEYQRSSYTDKDKPSYNSYSSYRSTSAEKPSYSSSRTTSAERPSYNSSTTSAERPSYNFSTSSAERPSYNSSTTSADRPSYSSYRATSADKPSYSSSRASVAEKPSYVSKYRSRERKSPDPDDNYGDYIRSKLKDMGLDRIRDVAADASPAELKSTRIDPAEPRVRPVPDFPGFDRTTKPAVTTTTTRSRTYGSQGSGLTGLKNLGNTCYMNSVVQCLAHIEPLKEYFLDGDYKNSLNTNSTTRGHIAEEFGSVLERLWSGQNRSFACTDFKSTVGRYRPDWAGRDQQDADDFLVFVLDCLHEDLNGVKRKQPLKEQNNDEKSDSEASRIALSDWQTSNQSKISELFYGQEKSALICGTCGHSSVRFDMICTLVVPIPASVRHCELDDCLSLYTKGETIPDWNCPTCKHSREANKKLDLYRTPKILIITLKRFLREGYDYWKKRQTTVDYPLNNLRINGSTYRLVAVINHYGTLDGGHYTASAYHTESKEWYKFDDSDVHSISPSEAVTSAAYILFYSKCL